MPLTLPTLPYAPDALEPHFDSQTMQIHHGKHHNAYVTNANNALTGTPWADRDIHDIIRHLDQLPADKQTAVRNNAGGHANHSLFWQILAPASRGGGGTPTGALANAITRDLGGYDKFKEAFAHAATTRFGSGWAWLCVAPAGTLHISSTANQDNPIMPTAFGGHGHGHAPILGLDVWEHAYYLKYQNRRPDYVAAFFNLVNWPKVAELFAAAGGK